MPAVGTVRTRAEAIAHAIAAAQQSLEQHLLAANILADSDPLIQAHLSLLRAAQLLERAPKPINRSGPAKSLSHTQPAPGPDDLTRIRGIDQRAVAGLSALGITRFEQIAAWEPEDIRSIGHALDLGRSFQNNGVIDQAKMLLAPVNVTGGTVGDTFAGWSPRPADDAVVTAGSVSAPLTAADFAQVHATLRRGPGRYVLRHLPDIVPLIARVVDIPDELFDPFDEAPWRPSPLMETASPVTEDERVAVEPVQIEAAGSAAVLVAPTVDVRLAPPSEPPLAVEPIQEKPLHIVTLDRIAALDAEISTFGARPDSALQDESAHPVEVPAATASEAPTPPAKPTSRLLQTAAPRLLPLGAPLEEADVTITVRSGRSPSMLQPMPELPLQPKRVQVLKETQSDAPTEISEAAVVIVKRRSKERAAPDLEFYKRGSTNDDSAAARTSKRVERELAS